MLLLRRTAATIIDLAVFGGFILALHPLFLSFQINLEPKYFLFITYLVALIFPILFTRSTLGLKILNLEVSSKEKLLVKYVIYYLLFSGMIISFFKISSELIGSSIVNGSLISFGLIFFTLLFVLSILSILLFLGSLGKYNLFDFPLKLIYNGNEYSRNKVLILCIWLSVVFSSVALLMIIERSGVKSFYEFFLNPDETYSVNEYFPRDKFDNYSYHEFVKRESSNDILSFSKPESFTSDIFLTQKTIYSAINKSTFESFQRRYELCLNLLLSSLDNDLWANKHGDIDQTKFVLIYSEEHTFFTNTTYVFEYFYDNKNPKHSIYGGIDLDSLISQIKTHWLNSNNELEKIAKLLNVPTIELLDRADSTGTITFTDEEIKILRSQPLRVEPSDQFYLTIKGFRAVEPHGMISFNIPKRPAHFIEVSGNFYFNDKLYEAIAYRNALTTKY